MKKILSVIFLFACTAAFAQSKDEKELTEKTYLLSNTVFGSKDSIILDNLAARTLTYGHSHGKLQTREEMIQSVTRNKSIYTDTAIWDMKIFINGKTAIVRYLFKAKENKRDGTVAILDLGMMLVWVKEKREWKLMGRQAVSLR